MIAPQTFKAIRAISGLTQLALAEAARCSPTAVAEFEAGKRDLRAGTLGRLLEAMGARVVIEVGGTRIG